MKYVEGCVDVREQEADKEEEGGIEDRGVWKCNWVASTSSLMRLSG